MSTADRFPDLLLSARPDRDEDGFPDIPEAPPTKCLYCDRTGGEPFLMIGEELHCSLCFEGFTASAFWEYLEDSGVGYVAPVLGPDRAGRVAAERRVA